MPEFKTLAGFFTRTQLFSDMKYRVNKNSPLQEQLKQRILKSVHLSPEDVDTERGLTIWTTIETLVGDTLLSRRNSVLHGVKLKLRSKCFGCLLWG